MKKKIILVAIAAIILLLVVLIVNQSNLSSQEFDQYARYDCGEGYLFDIYFNDDAASLALPGQLEPVLLDRIAVESPEEIRYQGGSGQNEFRTIDGEAILTINDELLYSSCFVVPGTFSSVNIDNVRGWQTYMLDVDGAGYGVYFNYPNEFAVDSNDNTVDIAFDDQSIMSIAIAEGQFSETDLSFDPEGGVEPVRLNGYAGYVYLSAETNQLVTDLNLDTETTATISYQPDQSLPQDAIALVIQSLEFFQRSAAILDEESMATSVSVTLFETSDPTVAPSCDDLAVVERMVTPTRNPLEAAIEQLFVLDGDDVTGYSNPLADNDDLSFVRAIVIDGRAKVYLNGFISSAADSCVPSQAQTQLQQTALQIEGVDSVELYLNGVLVENLSDQPALIG